jgi:hypothetical protein
MKDERCPKTIEGGKAHGAKEGMEAEYGLLPPKRDQGSEQGPVGGRLGRRLTGQEAAMAHTAMAPAAIA